MKRADYRDEIYRELMTITDARERRDVMVRQGFTPADFGKTARQMGINPRALLENPRSVQEKRWRLT